MVQGAKAAVNAAQTGQRKLAENVAEYFLEEKPLLIRPALAEEFGASVVKLRDDVERAGKRLEKLEQKLARRAAHDTPDPQ
jgi:ubiquinone biosynthesis protein UbiJ